jgi:hypothetical protein
MYNGFDENYFNSFDENAFDRDEFDRIEINEENFNDWPRVSITLDEGNNTVNVLIEFLNNSYIGIQMRANNKDISIQVLFHEDDICLLPARIRRIHRNEREEEANEHDIDIAFYDNHRNIDEGVYVNLDEYYYRNRVNERFCDRVMTMDDYDAFNITETFFSDIAINEEINCENLLFIIDKTLLEN